MKNHQLGRIFTTLVALTITTHTTQTAFAQADATQGSNAATAIAATDDLSIGLPPNARLKLDIDARDEDILGVVKSLLKGVNGEGIKGMMNHSMKPGAPLTESDPAAPPAEAQTAVNELLSKTDLGIVLKDITHMRVAYFELPTMQRTTPVKNKPATGPQPFLRYYEQKYLAGEGGRRIIRADFDEAQMLMVGFGKRGFAIVMQTPITGIGVVIRADGYPDLEGIGPLAMAAFSSLAPMMGNPMLGGPMMGGPMTDNPMFR